MIAIEKFSAGSAIKKCRENVITGSALRHASPLVPFNNPALTREGVGPEFALFGN
jgi:hypothetical protein